MSDNRIDHLKSKLLNFNIEFTDVNGTPGIIVHKDQLVEVCKLLRDDSDLKYNALLDAVSVDRFTKKDRYEMIYNLVSIEFNRRLFVKVRIDGVKPEVESLCSVWKSANWYEREAYDMMGINFLNHPDLRRMYMPESYEYYPLRKDFPLMGIPDSIPLPNK